MNRRVLAHGLILGAFCLGFGALLAATHRLTAEDIAARTLEDRQTSLGQVIPDAIHDNNPVTDVIDLTDAEGRPLTVYRARARGKVTGVAYEIRGSGYAGQIRLMLGVGADGQILGVRVLAHKETPGLGDKIETRKSNWILGFTNLTLGHPPREKWKVRKDGGEFDQFTGATITPRAVVGAVRDGLELFAAHRAEMLEER